MDAATILKVLTLLSKEANQKRKALETVELIIGCDSKTIQTEILTIVEMMDKIASLVK